MENPYFRSYIRRYACTAEEIINALKKSSENVKEEILQELNGGSLEYINNNNINQSEDMVIRTCSSNTQYKCLNGGTCLTAGMINFCRCLPNWDGRHCEYLRHEVLYGEARVAPEVQSLAPVIMLLIVLIGLVLAFGLLYLSRTVSVTVNREVNTKDTCIQEWL